MQAPSDRASEKLTTWTLAAIVFTILWSVLLGATGPDSDRDLPRRFDSPGIALQAAANAEEFRLVVGAPTGEAWTAFRLQTGLDCVFPLGYAGAFAGMGLLLRKRNCRPCRLAGAAAIAFAAGAALCDWAENGAILHSVSNPLDYTPWLHRFSCAKWTLVGAASLCCSLLWMSPLPLNRELKVWSWIAALLYVSAGVLCWVGVAWPPAWERLGTPLAVAWVIAAAILALVRRDLSEGLYSSQDGDSDPVSRDGSLENNAHHAIEPRA
jgi:hypothetical protein